MGCPVEGPIALLQMVLPNLNASAGSRREIRSVADVCRLPREPARLEATKIKAGGVDQSGKAGRLMGGSLTKVGVDLETLT